jgi:predicted dehydrogenase
VADSDPATAQALARDVGAAVSPSWQALVADPAVGIVCVATPNGFLAEIGCAALAASKHVLVEKPMGRNVDEARAITAAAQAANRRVKVGFNHRYHPAIARAHEELVAGTIGSPVNARARYGHGGRPGYENEWRGDVRLAGGGELTDQGVHIADLLHWFLGVPSEVYAVTQTAVWPLGALEDNGFAIIRYPGGQIASMHTSWTQWKNLFSLEIFGDRGSLVVEGLGGSYGEETLTVAHRAMQGGAPRMDRFPFPGPDQSWALEWDDFLGGVLDGRPYLGGAEDGLIAMTTLDALYRSTREQRPVLFASGNAARAG